MTDDQARAKLEQIAADIKSGKTLANAARVLSGSGALPTVVAIWAGLRPISTIRLRDALTNEQGQLSAPVHSSFGWHLIELMDTRNVDKTDAAQKDRAYRMLFNRNSLKKRQPGCRNNAPALT